ncbi:MAG TPA: hypothetical protein VJJ52_00200 [Candidatus Nanoarchaeia archaeon]|nr:hypothetical protein [Candidatus Nanoarchaeia archaeon]
MNYEQELKKAKTFADIFELVKSIVMESLGAEQAGLMVGVSDLGAFSHGFVGAFYSLNANMIIINKKPLARILQTNPSIYNYYLFHVILHEYIHSIGSYDEMQTRQLVYQVSSRHFGSEHTVTKLAQDITKFMPNLIYEEDLPSDDVSIEFIKGIDKKNINYIN